MLHEGTTTRLAQSRYANVTDDSRSLDVISKGDHANRLPDTQTYTRGNTSVQALDTVRLVNVGQGVQDGLFLRSSYGVGRLHGGLHFDSND